MADGILVLDVGSSALKAVIFDRAGGVRAQAEASYPTGSPQPGWFTQAPDDWAAAAAQAISRLGDLRGVVLLALSGTMQNLIPLDAAGQPLRPALLYSDGRAAGRVGADRTAVRAAGAERQRQCRRGDARCGHRRGRPGTCLSRHDRLGGAQRARPPSAHPTPDLLIEVAPILSAGDAAAWLADLLGPAEAADLFRRSLAASGCLRDLARNEGVPL